MDSLYERTLLQVGNEGLFQKKFGLFYIILFPTLWAMAYHNIILALTITPHTCKVPDKPASLNQSLWRDKYIPKVKNAAEIEILSDCLIYTGYGNETKGCDFFDYDTTWFETTVPSDNNWVCDNEINVANIFAYTKIGETIGSLVFGWFGDVYGRKPTYVASLILLVIGRFISVVASSSFALFAIGCIIASFPSWSAPQSTFIILLEVSSPKRRTTVAKFHLVANSCGLCLMPFLYWWLRNWKSFLIITTALQLPYLLLSWKIIESPQWLWISGKSKLALRCLKIIARVNKTTLSSDVESEILTTSPAETNKTDFLGPLALFSGWRVSLSTMLQLFIWVSVTVNYTVAIMSSGEKSVGNPFLDFAWQSLAEIPGHFIAAWLADRIGRRYTGISSFLLTTVIWFLYGYREVSSALWIKNEWLITILAVINRTSITVSFYIINLLNMEIYPTCLRQSGMSLGNVVSGGASAFAPYILYLGRRVDVRYPSAILIATTIIGGVLSTFYLPETMNVRLPETLEDARIFGSKKRRGVDMNNKTEEVELAVSNAET